MKNEVKIGLLTIVVLVTMIWGFKFLKGENFFENTNTYFISYTYVDQLTASSPVLINGFQVGSVTQINLDPESMKQVIVEIVIDGKISIPKNTIASLESSGIMGGKMIALYFDNPCTGEGCAANKSFLKAGTKGLLGSMVDENEVDNYFLKFQDGITGLFDSLSNKMGGSSNSESGMDETIADLQHTIKNLAEMSSKINGILDRSSSSVNQTVKNLAALSKTLEQNNGKIDNIIGNFETVSEDLKNANLSSTIEEATLAIDQIKGTVDQLKETVNLINAVVENVEKGEGTLGKLVKDDALYDNLESTSANLDRLLQDLRLNPKRYVHISVFGKKQKEFTNPEEDPSLNK